uniref:Uncharacterized protein n=1 Tax=Anguilla anguilla TaxID=7936 RepID=A0A0E9RE62_ANGAN
MTMYCLLQKHTTCQILFLIMCDRNKLYSFIQI